MPRRPRPAQAGHCRADRDRSAESVLSAVLRWIVNVVVAPARAVEDQRHQTAAMTGHGYLALAAAADSARIPKRTAISSFMPMSPTARSVCRVLRIGLARPVPELVHRNGCGRLDSAIGPGRPQFRCDELTAGRASR